MENEKIKEWEEKAKAKKMQQEKELADANERHALSVEEIDGDKQSPQEGENDGNGEKDDENETNIENPSHGNNPPSNDPQPAEKSTPKKRKPPSTTTKPKATRKRPPRSFIGFPAPAAATAKPAFATGVITSKSLSSLWKLQQMLEHQQKKLEQEQAEWKQRGLVAGGNFPPGGTMGVGLGGRQHQWQNQQQLLNLPGQQPRYHQEDDLDRKQPAIDRIGGQVEEQAHGGDGDDDDDEFEAPAVAVAASRARKSRTGGGNGGGGGEMMQRIEMMKRYKELVDIGYDDDTIVAMIPDMKVLVELVSKNKK